MQRRISIDSGARSPRFHGENRRLRRPPRYAALGVLLASALALGSCGGDGDENGGGAQPAKTQPSGGAAAPVSQVELAEYKFTPSDVTAKRGSTITAINKGSIGHDLKLRTGGKVAGGTEVFDAAKSVKLKVDFKPGRYEMFCSVPGHEDLGMKGTFTVK
jgi:uncharacterized cupredoxin-like copper-binding protein